MLLQMAIFYSFLWLIFHFMYVYVCVHVYIYVNIYMHSICQQIWKTQQWSQDWKRSGFIPIPKKGNAKECSLYHTIALISHSSKVILKILQVRFQQYVNHEIPDVQAGFTKRRGTRGQIANIRWIIKKATESLKKDLFLLYWLCQSLWLCGSQ